MNLHQWAIKHGVPAAAVFELQNILGETVPVLPEPGWLHPNNGKSEAFVQSLVKLRASQEGIKVSRNNVGALIPQGSKKPIRFGLFNESEQVNELVKSSDLIGWRPVVITLQHVGMRIAQFWARECKEPSWVPGRDEREVAQGAFINMVNRDGGDAAFTNGAGL